MTATPLLVVRDLTIGVPRKGREPIILVDKASFEVATGERFGIVGESGSGKSMTLRAIAGLLPKGVKVLGGSIEFEGSDVLRMSKTARRNLMGPGIAMIFQEPMTALNPTMRVADQIAEGLRVHRGMPKAAARARAIDLMKRTGIPDAERRAAAFPHELSGGLRQRVMIALAVSCSPKVLLCDEPTTALDVTVQHQVLKLLEDLCDEFGTSLVFVTHDLAVVNQTCQRLAVMYAGRIVESGLVGDVFPAPRHPYTIGLLNSAPDFDKPDRELVPIPGFPPNLAAREPGCAFRPRCPFAIEACATTNPPLEWVEEGRAAACLRAGDIAKREVLA